ncbi:MAG: hypothetical protein ACI9MJ_001781, partial [Alphaproteobacteria bacterium]
LNCLILLLFVELRVVPIGQAIEALQRAPVKSPGPDKFRPLCRDLSRQLRFPPNRHGDKRISFVRIQICTHAPDRGKRTIAVPEMG